MFWRRVATVAALGLLAFANLALARAAGLDPAQMSADEIRALQQRLSDAGCFKSAIDGVSSGAIDAGLKACPDQRPILRIETGMHTAPIKAIGVDAACRLLATASDDKTVRLWSLPDGKLQRVVRLPIGDGDSGKVFATALSPDGRWLAAGGWDAEGERSGKYRLTIIDLASGAIRRVTSSFDGQLRRYGPDLELTVKRAAPDGKKPMAVEIDPSGRRLAVGYFDETPVSILDAKTLAPIAKAQTGDLGNGDLDSVA